MEEFARRLTRVSPMLRQPSGARLARAVLGYLTLNIAVITLAPFRFSATPVNGLTSVFGIRDAVLNIVLFLPLGFVYQLSLQDRERARWMLAFAAGLMLSAMLEGAQVFAPGRYPSLSDLMTNALGAALGAWMASRAAQRADGTQALRALALDLPLVGLTYLLLPVLWLTALSASEGGSAAVLLLLGSAAWIIGSVHASYGAPEGHAAAPLRVLRLSSGALLFLAVGLAPLTQADPLLALQGAVLFALFIVIRLRAPSAWTVGRTARGEVSRRFEGSTLRVALAPLVCFAVIISVWPLPMSFAGWEGTWALTRGPAVPSDATLYRVMAVLAAYTALGYGIAATHGRRVESLGGLALRALGWTLALAVPLEWLRGWGEASNASATMLALTGTAAVLGAGIYQLQLRHIQALLKSR